jgi:hypothetical protein
LQYISSNNTVVEQNTIMSSTTNNADEASVTSFPLEARVILHSLKAADLNGKIGVIKSDLSSADRQTVFIPQLDRSVGLKPSNLRYEPRTLESLSVKELKMILKKKNNDGELVGMDKSDLRSEVTKLMSSKSESESESADENEIPKLLAKAKLSLPKPVAPVTVNNNNPGVGSQAADNLGNMNPDQLRQQARMMRTMDPNYIRQTNPQLAHMSDEQIRGAADQMEMMANNPAMMKQAADQIRNMDPTELQRMQAQMTGGNNGTASSGSTIPTNTTSTTPLNVAPNGTPTANQAEQAANMMANMSPDQLRQQAQMLKTMDPNTIRATNPQLAHMTDEQIKQAASQFEMMASNPAMMKMAMEQLKGGAGQPGSSPADMAAQMGAGGDAGQMLANMDKTQMKQMLNSLKESPEMMKQFAGMTGMNEEQLRKGVESFASMDDTKMDSALKMMQTAQKAKDKWNTVNSKVGGHLLKILIVMGVLLIGYIVSYIVIRRSISSDMGDGSVEDLKTILQPETTTHIEEDLDSEF